MFIGRTDAEAETPILWPPPAKSWLIGKDPDAGRDWGQEEKGMPEDEMAGWYHRLSGHEFGWTPGVDDGQGGLACCNSWGHEESDMSELLNWTELNVPPFQGTSLLPLLSLSKCSPCCQTQLPSKGLTPKSLTSSFKPFQPIHSSEPESPAHYNPGALAM